MANRALLIVSFGSSYRAARERAMAPVESALAGAFPGFDLARAFTSRMVIEKLMARDGVVIENPFQAIDRLCRSGYGEVLVQPLLVIAGTEYDQLLSDLDPFRAGFDRLAVGAPLLSSPADYNAAAAVLRPYYRDGGGERALVLMGHGSRHAANAAYAKLEEACRIYGLTNLHVATVEGEPALEDILPRLKADGIKSVNLMPFMLTAGDHAQNDMAGDGEESWKTRLEKEGLTVDVHLSGLGELEGIRRMFIDHALAAWEGGYA